MPINRSSSNEAREENIKTEMHAHPGMNPKQAVAIGYSEQREAEKHEHEHNKYGRKSPY